MLPVLSWNTSTNVNGYRLNSQVDKHYDLWELYYRMGVTLIEAQLINVFFCFIETFLENTQLVV